MKRLPDLFDLLVILGLGTVGYGLYLISIPLALIITGSIVLLIGIYGAWMKAGSGGKHGG